MYKYLDKVQQILDTGNVRTDRTGTGTVGIFGTQSRFMLSGGFPILTTKKVPFRLVAIELLFFLSGKTNNNILVEQNCHIWDEWADSNGNLGPIYSHQWRHFGAPPKSVPQPKPTLPDGLIASVSGVGFNDVAGVTGDSGEIPLLYRTWKTMLARCYTTTHDAYPYYGGRGVSVCNRWLVFSNFLADVRVLVGWENKQKSWGIFQLDKDIRGDGFQYSPSNCAWVSKTENMQAKYTERFVVQHESGELATIDSPADFIAIRNIHQGNFSAMLRGERPTAQGWSLVHKYDTNEGFDQISWVINEIKTNPNSRRLIVSAWNPAQMQYQALPPCHTLFQFYVQDGALSCHLYQRSADTMLGVPFNIASYALLTYMVAHVCDLEVGDLIISIGDHHIYSNHLDGAKEQLNRIPYELPTLKIKRKVDSIFDFKLDDFELEGYKHHPAIKMDVSV